MEDDEWEGSGGCHSRSFSRRADCCRCAENERMQWRSSSAVWDLTVDGAGAVRGRGRMSWRERDEGGGVGDARSRE